MEEEKLKVIEVLKRLTRNYHQYKILPQKETQIPKIYIEIVN